MLKKAELNKIVESIKTAEGETSVEIRVCVVHRCKIDPYEAALRKFYEYKMDKTALRNGVLIYVAPKNKKAAIMGDVGIDAVVSEGFWDEALEDMLKSFAKDELCEGICRGVSMVGEMIQDKFPIAEDDINELSDEVIIDEE